MNVLGITLARGGGKGVPKKNIRPILGKPLICYTINEAKKSNMLTNYIVCSDDLDILAIAHENGVDCLVEPRDLAQDDTPIFTPLLWAIDAAEKKNHIEYDIVADIRCTNPLKIVYDIDGAIQLLIDSGADCVAGVSESDHPCRIKTIVYDDDFFPHLVDVWDEPESGLRQDMKPDAFIRNGSIYVATVAHLRSGKYFVGTDVVPWIMPKMRSINIDNWIDFWTCAAILENMNG
jgi:CMP-N-acetylneuraminic acid synthetase